MSDETTGNNIRHEIAKQLVIAAFAVAVIAAESQLRPEPGSDSKETKMYLALKGEALFQRLAERCARAADKCKQSYDRYRL